MRIRRDLIALAALVALAVGAPGRGTAQENPAITIGASTFDSSTAVVYAVKAGLFQKAGLDVKLVPMTPAAIPSAVIGGTIQIASSNLLNVVEAHVRGVPFTVVAPGAMFDRSDVNGYVALIVRNDSGIRTARDLDGKTIGVPALQDLNTIASMAWIDENGGTSSTVRYVEIPAPTAAAALAAHRIDATLLTSPLLQTALANGDLRVLTDAYSAIGKSYLGLGWISTQAFAAAHPDLIERFARVMHDAGVYCNTHQAETLPLIAEFGNLNPATLPAMKRVTFAPYLSPAMIQPIVDAAAKYKVIPARFDAQELVSPYALKGPGR